MIRISRCILLIIISIFTFQVNISTAAVSCTSSYNNKLIGSEYVADTCPTTSNQTMHFIQTAVQCTNGIVTLFAHYGDELTSPGNIVNYLIFSNFRVFGNTLGNHIVGVHSNFGSSPLDTIDGEQMSNYPAGSFNLNVFDKILYPQAASNDADNDHYLICDDCNDNDASINPATAEICGDGIDNNCNDLSDCDEQVCSGQDACIEISPMDFTRDCNLENGSNIRF